MRYLKCLLFLVFCSFAQLALHSDASAAGFAKLPDIAKQQNLEKPSNIVKVRRGVRLPKFIPVPIVIPGGRNANFLLWLGLILAVFAVFKHLKRAPEEDDYTAHASGRNYQSDQKSKQVVDVDAVIEEMLQNRANEQSQKHSSLTGNSRAHRAQPNKAKPVFGKRTS